jgi:hypothetical protein
MVNWKGFGKKRSWPNFKIYPGILLEILRKITKNLAGEPLSGPRLNPETFRARSRNFKHSKTTFGSLNEMR